MRRRLARFFIHIWQYFQVGDAVGSLLPPLDLPILHYDIFVKKMALGADDEIVGDPIMPLGPLDLALVEIGPIAELLDVADHCQVFADLCFVLD